MPVDISGLVPVGQEDPRWSRKFLTDTGEAGKCRALMTGTDGMRKLGVKYLPRFVKEQPEKYEDRRRISFLFSAFERLVRDFTGRVAGRPLTWPENAPAFWELWREQADGAGSSFDLLARRFFQDALLAGLTIAIVDAPQRMEGESLEDSYERFPWVSMHHAESVINFESKPVNGKLQLLAFRIQIDSDTRHEYLRAPEGTISRSVWKLEKDSGKYVLEDTFVYPPEVQEVPVVPIYANKTGYFMGYPPLRDVADLNIELWQQSSAYSNLLLFVSMPILYGYGFPDDMEYGPNTVVMALKENSFLRFVEHSGKGAEVARQKIVDIKAEIEKLGVQFATEKGMQAETATAVARDMEREASKLQMVGENVQQGLREVLRMVSIFAGQDVVEDVSFDSMAEELDTSHQATQVLLQLERESIITPEQLVEELKRRGILPEAFQFEALPEPEPPQLPGFNQPEPPPPDEE